MSAQSISLKTGDGHGLSAYEARPDKSPRGGIVLLQEIFGITGYIRRVSEGYAEHGYHVVAPALFDRVRPGIELNYSKEDAVIGRLGRWTVDHGRAVAIAWIVIAIGFGVFAP
ncbi:MAG: dienelactone hydrolase family protein, partial [Pseudolabrys sp.]